MRDCNWWTVPDDGEQAYTSFGRTEGAHALSFCPRFDTAEKCVAPPCIVCGKGKAAGAATLAALLLGTALLTTLIRKLLGEMQPLRPMP